MATTYETGLIERDGTLYGGGGFWAGRIVRVAPGSQKPVPIDEDLVGKNISSRFSGTANAISIISDGAGTIYGITQGGGLEGCGTVFKLGREEPVVTTLASFDGNNGNNPSGRLVIDGVGNLYGVAGGGVNGAGVLFKIASGTQEAVPLAVFNTVRFGTPTGDIAADSAGNLYGATAIGGEHRFGGVFKVDPKTGQMAFVASFDGNNGYGPLIGVTIDRSGNIYGTAGGALNSPGNRYYKLPVGVNTHVTQSEYDSGVRAGCFKRL